MSSSLNIVISGGGTGGHLFPALAIGDELQSQNPNILIHYIGSKFGIEKDVLPIKNVQHSLLPIRGLQRSLDFNSLGKNILLPGRIISSLSKIKQIFNEIKPRLVIGTGGYASALPLREGINRKIPTLIQEQNSFPGITTRWFANNVNKVCIAFEEAQSMIKKQCIITGNPIRSEINTGIQEFGLKEYGFDKNKKTVLLFGGSQGSLALNQMMDKMVTNLSISSTQIIWQTGKKFFNNYSHHENKTVRVIPFINNMANAYAASDLVISRAGAITCSELTVCGKPSILIPFPAAAGNHQEKNARALADNGASIIIDENKTMPTELASIIQNLLNNKVKLKSMANSSKKLSKPDATAIIVQQAMRLLN
ncbi:MAG: undecaprenyldiphospho-muramoylpentapeptide beta-N-acetylglucosaminyltransferase [Candidatus Marinimicrobia bacterium]|nr:undecaprenyldiphospho-muramoylpentapeptide beta-N-acetylglucosaminyltransferase [Candidatus Neomarinimicrobiota bacterium]